MHRGAWRTAVRGVTESDTTEHTDTLLLLLLLSRFSRVRLCVTPETAAHQAPPRDSSPPGSPSLGFSRQEHWSGVLFPRLKLFLLESSAGFQFFVHLW